MMLPFNRLTAIFSILILTPRSLNSQQFIWCRCLNQDFLSRDDLEALPFKQLGRNVLIHPTVVIVNSAELSIGDNVRIDPFCVLSAKQISIGSCTHISSHGALLGGAAVILDEFVNLSPRATILTSNDDFHGQGLAGAMLPEAVKATGHGDVVVRRHCIVGAGTVVLPGLEIGEGCAIGALSLVKRSLEPWGIYAGVPVRRIRERSRTMLGLHEGMARNERGDRG
jgi:acetyltransferase-like isoleucine patch superfamily enzyme